LEWFPRKERVVVSKGVSTKEREKKPTKQGRWGGVTYNQKKKKTGPFKGDRGKRKKLKKGYLVTLDIYKGLRGYREKTNGN